MYPLVLLVATIFTNFQKVLTSLGVQSLNPVASEEGLYVHPLFTNK